jgi:hypothetical protein
MKTWFTSLNGAITISALALLSFVGYGLMEMRYFLGKWIPGDGVAMVEMIIMLLIVGGWLRALFVAANGRRGGLVAMLAFSVFNILIGLYDLHYVLNTPMPWPEQLTVIGIAIVGVIATAVVGVFMRKAQIKT